MNKETENPLGIRRAILPGSYDPVTIGHLEIIKQAAEQYDEIYVVVFVNPDKKCRFTPEERVKMLLLATDELENCIVSYSPRLVVDYMRDHGIETIVKGYRNDTDYQYEMKQAEWNLTHGGYKTVLFKSSADMAEISSTEVRRRMDAGEDISDILPKDVAAYIRNR